MNDPIRWDSSLVKKFSSSNHYKLLNQLRNEVKKYPLNNKKLISSNERNENTVDNKNKTNISITNNLSLSKNVPINNEINSSKSSVSFNNSKNFSIYNNHSNDPIKQKTESVLTDQNKSNTDSSLATFKDRLDQVEMK